MNEIAAHEHTRFHLVWVDEMVVWTELDTGVYTGESEREINRGCGARG